MGDKYNAPNYPPQSYQGPGSPPPQGGYYEQDRGYYNGPPQGMNYGPPGPQYGGPQYGQPGPYQQGPYPQQPMYVEDRRGGGTAGGICAGLAGALACCCCLDCLF